MKTVFRNLLKAIGIMAYFVILNIAYVRMNADRLMNDIEIFAGAFLVFGLIMLEVAYKKDSGKTAISGIELLVLSMHSLSIKHVITFYQYDFRFYLLTSSYVFAIYYVLKSIIIYTKEKRKYLKNLSDISEIVKEEPIKKEAKKRRKTKETKSEENKKIDKQYVKEKLKQVATVKKDEEKSKKTKNKDKKEKEEEVRKENKKQEKKPRQTKKEKKTEKIEENEKKVKGEEVKTKTRKKKKEVVKDD